MKMIEKAQALVAEAVDSAVSTLRLLDWDDLDDVEGDLDQAVDDLNEAQERAIEQANAAIRALEHWRDELESVESYDWTSKGYLEAPAADRKVYLEALRDKVEGVAKDLKKAADCRGLV